MFRLHTAGPLAQLSKCSCCSSCCSTCGSPQCSQPCNSSRLRPSATAAAIQLLPYFPPLLLLSHAGAPTLAAGLTAGAPLPCCCCCCFPSSYICLQLKSAVAPDVASLVTDLHPDLLTSVATAAAAVAPPAASSAACTCACVPPSAPFGSPYYSTRPPCICCMTCWRLIFPRSSPFPPFPHPPFSLTSLLPAASSPSHTPSSLVNTAGRSGPSAVRAAPVSVAASMIRSGPAAAASYRASLRMRRPSASVLPFCKKQYRTDCDSQVFIPVAYLQGEEGGVGGSPWANGRPYP